MKFVAVIETINDILLASKTFSNKKDAEDWAKKEFKNEDSEFFARANHWDIWEV